MTGNPASVSVLALTGCLVCLGMLTAQGTVRAQTSRMSGPDPHPAHPVQRLGATDEPGQKQSRPVHFDIPRQPLALSLDRYGATTGLPVFFDSAMVAGRMASAVHGFYDPEMALRAMLEGSGLVASNARPGQAANAFVLRLADTARSTNAASQDAISTQTASRKYDGLIQTRIREAFCANDRIDAGDYRIAMRFEIDVAGQIIHPLLLASTGDRARDIDVIDTLKKIRVDYAPPDNIAQPFTMVILPRALDRGAECAATLP